MEVIYNKQLEFIMEYPIGIFMVENKILINEMIKSFISIKAFKNSYVNIICRGSSGAIIAGIFSFTIPNDNKIIYIRKTGEESHQRSGYSLRSDAINLIVDDFICTGETIRSIISSLDAHQGKSVEIDCICVSGRRMGEYGFEPKYFICGRD